MGPFGEVRYALRVTWSEDDQAYVANCAEFPSVSWLASTPEEALAGLRETLASVIVDMETSGEAVPVPGAEGRGG